jgi:isocitrate dehydrogenase kinase/phosphatase
VTPILDDLASAASERILDDFRAYYLEFKAIMARSKSRFERREWARLAGDADERLALYQRAVDASAESVDALLSDSAADAGLWEVIRSDLEQRVGDPGNVDLVRAYFSTVKRRFIPVDAHDFERDSWDLAHPDRLIEEVRFLPRSPGADNVAGLLRRILSNFPFAIPYVDLETDLRQAAALIEDRLSEDAQSRAIAILKPLFFRGKRAHVIGRMWNAGRFVPLVIALTNTEEGLRIAEVLVGDEETSSLFSFTRSQFHVVTSHHRELMAFLKSVAPAKSAADLYAAVGYHNLSKSALLADLFRQVREPGQRFRRTLGTKGTVMITFDLPESRFVIKVIRDHFLTRRVDPTREKVMQRYGFVRHVERAGRILDIFHFHKVRFDRAWFDEDLLEDLIRSAPSTIVLDDDRVVLRDFYAQRKVTPLDVFFREPSDRETMRRVVIDFGFLHKELAARNIFTGDVVPNNFGVVSIGKRTMRVVSFDYDGYSRLTDMRFLETRDDDEWSPPEDQMVIDEEWDVLPEKFRVTFGIPEPYREEFDRVHGELYRASYWLGLKDELSNRPEVVDTFPYDMIARRRGEPVVGSILT